MKKIMLTTILLLTFSISFAQKHIEKYYVGGLLYCKYTYYLNKEHVEGSYIEVTNTQRYNGMKYYSCSTCRYLNHYNVGVYSFAEIEGEKSFTLYVRDIDKERCILVFQDEKKNEENTEIYYARRKVVK